MNDKALKELLLERYDHHMKQIKEENDCYQANILYFKMVEICDIMLFGKMINDFEYLSKLTNALKEYQIIMTRCIRKGE